MPWRHEFDLGSVHVGFVVNKVALRFFASTSVFPYQHHSTKAQWTLLHLSPMLFRPNNMN